MAGWRSGLRLSGSCDAVSRGTARLTASAKNARRLGLGKRAATLGQVTVRCASGHFAATLRPSRKAGAPSAALRGQVVLRLELRMGTAADAATLKVRGRR